jgi:hypothetical protein
VEDREVVDVFVENYKGHCIIYDHTNISIVIFYAKQRKGNIEYLLPTPLFYGLQKCYDAIIVGQIFNGFHIISMEEALGII